MDRTPEPAPHVPTSDARANGRSSLPPAVLATAASRAGLWLAVTDAGCGWTATMRPGAGVRPGAASWPGPATGWRAAAFARALAGRYGRLADSPSPLDRTTLRPRPPIMFQPLHRRVVLQVAPRLTTTVLRQTVVPVVMGVARTVGTPPPGQRSAAPSMTESTVQRATTAAITTVERTVSRFVRVESARAGAEPLAGPTDALALPSAGRGAPVAPDGPVERVVRRLAAPPEPTPPPPPEGSPWLSAAQHDDSWPDDGRIVPRNMPAEPAVDVGLLTEQVIRMLDRRTVAQRERLGWS